jgi:hypothetical protein
MIKALKVMDPTEARCFRDVSAMIMSQGSNIKTLIKKEGNNNRRAGKQILH